MNDQPKPTTGEWTLETLESYRVHGGFRAYKLLEDINAALAAEKLKVEMLTSERATAVVSLQQQLAAEREKLDEAMRLLHSALENVKEGK